ncbi:hypothetical protein [Hymenobacter psoromatis]|uniref:hypothetical protein n=1 Tax=Hymenobacter psoromatis TaxID=1484116 RepID=UPI001CBF434D|nr:hypothetical protein [Hymenobacter psoromatis]
MKKPLLLLATLAFATASFAQTTPTPAAQAAPAPHSQHHKHPKTPAQRADHGTAMLTKKLGLTAAQQPQVHQILLTQAQEGQALRAQYPAKEQRPARHQAMQASRAKYQQQLQAVLSADQSRQLAALREAHHHRGERGGKLKG